MFEDLCLYSQVIEQMSLYNYKLTMRRFIQAFFEPVKFTQVRICILKKIGPRPEDKKFNTRRVTRGGGEGFCRNPESLGRNYCTTTKCMCLLQVFFDHISEVLCMVFSRISMMLTPKYSDNPSGSFMSMHPSRIKNCIERVE